MDQEGDRTIIKIEAVDGANTITMELEEDHHSFNNDVYTPLLSIATSEEQLPTSSNDKLVREREVTPPFQERKLDNSSCSSSQVRLQRSLKRKSEHMVSVHRLQNQILEQEEKLEWFKAENQTLHEENKKLKIENRKLAGDGEDKQGLFEKSLKLSSRLVGLVEELHKQLCEIKGPTPPTEPLEWRGRTFTCVRVRRQRLTWPA